MANFDIGETIICWRNTRNASGTYVDPTTSMKISIFDPLNGAEIEDQDMVKDETGKYHYDYNPASPVVRGEYRVIYTATDGARITIAKDNFILS